MASAGRSGGPDAGATPGAGGALPLAFQTVAIASLAIFVAALTLFRMSNNDIWIHLRTGEYVLNHLWVPETDPYSFIASSRHYVAHEWLAGVLFYLVHLAGGVKGLIFFKAGVIAASCAFLVGAAKMLRSRTSVILPAFVCMIYASSARYLCRPHIFSYLMAAVFLWLFFMYREGGRRRIWLYAMLPVHAVWTNIHGGFVQGIALMATFALGETLLRARARFFDTGEETASASDVKLLWLLVPGCIAASLVNPYGYRLLLFPFELTGMQLFMQTIYEWQPPYHPAYNTSTMFFSYMVQTAALCVFFFLAHRDRTRSREGGEALGMLNAILLAAAALCFVVLAGLAAQYHFATATTEASDQFASQVKFLMYAVLGLFSAFTVLNARSVDFTQAGIFALFFLMSLRHNRAVTDAAMATFVVLVAAASSFLDKRRERPAPEPKRQGKRRKSEEPVVPAIPERWVDRSTPAAVAAGLVLVLGVSVQTHNYNYYFDFRGGSREKGLGIASNMPICPTDYIKDHGIKGNAFVSYPLASMLIYKSYPDVKVNMDSRNDVYGEDLYREYINALRSPNSMLAYLSRHPIDFFLISYSDRLPQVFDAVLATGEWAPVYYDQKAFILLKRKPETEALIREEEFKVITPGIISPTRITDENAAAVLVEADRAIRDCEDSAFGYFYRSQALQRLGRLDEAISTNLKVLEFEPANASAYADMGYIYAKKQDYGRAVKMYEKAAEISPDDADIQRNLRNLRAASIGAGP